MPMRFEMELTLASRELSRLRQDVSRADTTALSASAMVRDHAAASRAATYVWLASVLERVVRTSLQSTIREISSQSVPASELRVSLLALLCDGDFQSMASGVPTTWERKIELLARVVEMTPAVLSEDVLPLDRRTIRGEHFDTIWLVLGLQGVSLPTPRHRIALKDLADGRNEVAHGRSDPITFGRTKATADIHRLVDCIGDAITNLLSELDDYLLRERFKR